MPSFVPRTYQVAFELCLSSSEVVDGVAIALEQRSEETARTSNRPCCSGTDTSYLVCEELLAPPQEVHSSELDCWCKPGVAPPRVIEHLVSPPKVPQEDRKISFCVFRGLHTFHFGGGPRCQQAGRREAALAAASRA